MTDLLNELNVPALSGDEKKKQSAVETRRHFIGPS